MGDCRVVDTVATYFKHVLSDSMDAPVAVLWAALRPRSGLAEVPKETWCVFCQSAVEAMAAAPAATARMDF